MSLFELLRNLLRNLFKKQAMPPVPEAVPVIHGQNMTNDEVRALLTPFTDKQWISDEVFECMVTSNFKAFLESNKINSKTYIVDKHDCDDYSYELIGDVTHWYPEGCIGIVWGLNANGAPHAWNFIIDENKQVVFVEPQTDAIFEPSAEKVWVMII